jgi:hypothetical protein
LENITKRLLTVALCVPEIDVTLLTRAAREIKNELRQFLNSDFTSKQMLGQVGFYRGKHVEFDWQTTLSELGVVAVDPTEQHQIDLFYNSKGAVSINIVGSIKKSAVIRMDFSKKGAIASESYKLRSISLDTTSLGKALRKYIEKNSWNRHFVILTKKFVTDGFSFVLSGRETASIELSANTTPGRFNIADISLSPTIKAEKSLEYRVIAGASIEPYFVVHKFLPKPDGSWVLQKYAQKDIYDYIG